MSSQKLAVSNVSKKFRVYRSRPSSLKEMISGRARLKHEDLWVLRDVSLGLQAGSILGIVGRNGSGKSTLLRIMAGIYKPTSGGVRADGQIGAVIELGAGFHPELTGRDNVYLNGALMGLRRAEIRECFDEIVAFSGIGDFIDTEVKYYSSGMYVRLGFSVAVNVRADIILIDEVIAVGDAEFKQRCRERIKDLAARGCAIAVVSHVVADVKELCDSVVWLEAGKVAASGDPDRVMDEYLSAAVNRSGTSISR